MKQNNDVCKYHRAYNRIALHDTALINQMIEVQFAIFFYYLFQRTWEIFDKTSGFKS